jgi:CRISPR-associated protein Csm1
MTDFSAYRELWKQAPESNRVCPPDYPGWLDSGLAVMGDFAGIQNYVFRPVPGAGGAARRLRSRSFHVSAYSELVMRWCKTGLAQGDPKTLYAAGGKFLIGIHAFPAFEATIKHMQYELDRWTWQHFGGEMIFHLAAVPFDSGKIPVAALQAVASDARNRPLEMVLLSPNGWSEHKFFKAAASGDGRCDACGMTQQVTVDKHGESLCQVCLQDEKIGSDLPKMRFAHISSTATPHISALGTNMELCPDKNGKTDGEWLALEGEAAGASPWHLFQYVPKNAEGFPMDFDEIADLAPGPRKWLGYLRIDGDGAGKHFTHLQGDPLRTWALSHLLNLFFADTANRLVTERFRNIYPVFGGGDDLFVVGPWTEALAFALELRKELRRVLGGDSLTFSAGLSLAKPREHILTQANLALKELESAKKIPGHGRTCGRDQVRALGVTVDWVTFEPLLKKSQQVAKWTGENEIPSSFLYQLLQLHNQWKRWQKPKSGKRAAPLDRYRPLLYYQIERNLKKGEAQEWAHSLLKPGSLWPWADFIARYAMLATQREKVED